jgi:hypothetical protein
MNCDPGACPGHVSSDALSRGNLKAHPARRDGMPRLKPKAKQRIWRARVADKPRPRATMGRLRWSSASQSRTSARLIRHSCLAPRSTDGGGSSRNGPCTPPVPGDAFLASPRSGRASRHEPHAPRSNIFYLPSILMRGAWLRPSGSRQQISPSSTAERRRTACATSSASCGHDLNTCPLRETRLRDRRRRPGGGFVKIANCSTPTPRWVPALSAGRGRTHRYRGAKRQYRSRGPDAGPQCSHATLGITDVFSCDSASARAPSTPAFSANQGGTM